MLSTVAVRVSELPAALAHDLRQVVAPSAGLASAARSSRPAGRPEERA